MTQCDTAYELYVPKVKHDRLQTLAQSDYSQQMIATEKTLVDYFKSQRWWNIENGKAILDNVSGLLWEATPKATRYKHDQQELAQINIGHILGLANWQLPTAAQLENLVKAVPKFPLLTGQCFEINNWWAWLTLDRKVAKLNEQKVSFGICTPSGQTSKAVRIASVIQSRNHNDRTFNIAKAIAVNTSFKATSYLEKIQLFLEKNWSFYPQSVSQEDSSYRTFCVALKKYKLLISLRSKEQLDTIETWKNIDYFSTRLPVIDNHFFIDNHKGLWEFYAPDAQIDKFNKVATHTFIRSRNPILDVQEATVAIDFGTSSTVVAIRQNGRDELLRIGIQEKDFNKPITSDQFENPTILEFVDLEGVHQAWHSEVFRPLLNWDHIHCSHEAKASLNNVKEANSKTLGSIFARLKQWALRADKDSQILITDQQGQEYHVDPLTEYHPVKGLGLQLGADYPELDPIELYAWFLGMNINWRGRGIFLDYYMTFPVAYPIEIKNKILASFRRGLMRSLPETIVSDEIFNQFNVREWASEPAAYAAAALDKLNIEPSEQGVHYAVFDFGGGTTDFDFGLYRNSTEEEEDYYDHIIEHFGAAGDQYLGGENLLENLSYIVFQNNLDVCRQNNVSFTQPLDAEKFIGYERLIDTSQTAYSNTALLMAKLRPFWEKGQFDDAFSGALDIQLLNREGEAVDCQFTVKQDELLHYLKRRILEGFIKFFNELEKSFEKYQKNIPEHIHLLLAGNSSRSKLVKDLLSTIENEATSQQSKMSLDLNRIFNGRVPKFSIHYPMNADIKKQDDITAKTGVALGLLRLCPGEGLKVINHDMQQNAENSPFQFYVGRQKRGKFEVVIRRGDAFNEWNQIGAINEDGVFLLLYSSSGLAISNEGMMRGDLDLKDYRIRFAGNLTGQKVFAKILAPTQIEICSASNLEEVTKLGGNNIQYLDL